MEKEGKKENRLGCTTILYFFFIIWKESITFYSKENWLQKSPKGSQTIFGGEIEIHFGFPVTSARCTSGLCPIIYAIHIIVKDIVEKPVAIAMPSLNLQRKSP